MACLGSFFGRPWSCLGSLDIRFTSHEDEANFLILLAEGRRLQTFVGGISVVSIWLFSELRLLAQRSRDRGDHEDIEVLDLHAGLALAGALAWLVAAVATACIPLSSSSKFCETRIQYYEWIWVPLASFCCALMAQPRSDGGPSQLGLVCVAMSATAMLPLRSAVSWLVYAVAVLSFIVGRLGAGGAEGTGAADDGVADGADSVALFMVATCLYRLGWCCEAHARVLTDGSDRNLTLTELTDDEGTGPDNKDDECVEALDHGVLRIASDLTIFPSLAEQGSP